MLEDGTYELVPEPEQGIFEDQVNIAEDLTEASNQSSKVRKLLTFLTKVHYKDNGRGYVRYHDLKEYAVCVDLSLIRSQCVVVVVKCLKVLATYRKYGTR
jgi:inosine-uridine nucleoside N-ribohydrolase